MALGINFKNLIDFKILNPKIKITVFDICKRFATYPTQTQNQNQIPKKLKTQTKIQAFFWVDMSV